MQPTDAAGSTSRATTIGVSVGVGVLLVVGIGKALPVLAWGNCLCFTVSVYQSSAVPLHACGLECLQCVCPSSDCTHSNKVPDESGHAQPRCADAVAASGVFMYRRQRPDLKAGAEAARSRHWGPRGPKQAPGGGGLDPPGFLGTPKPGAACFDNPLRAAQGDQGAPQGLCSIREDALEVQRNVSNYSNTSRDALLPGSGPGPGEGSPPRRPGALAGSPLHPCLARPQHLHGATYTTPEADIAARLRDWGCKPKSDIYDSESLRVLLGACGCAVLRYLAS